MADPAAGMDDTTNDRSHGRGNRRGILAAALAFALACGAGQPAYAEVIEDATFATTGTLDLPGTCGGKILGIEPLDDGSVLVEEACESPKVLRLQKLGPDGTVDTSFGDGGVASIRPPRYIRRHWPWEWWGATKANDGGAYVEMYWETYDRRGNPTEHYFVARLDADGNRDTAYGRGGFARFKVHSHIWINVCAESAVDALDRLVLFPTTYNDNVVAVRLTQDGHLDRSFGGNGRAKLGFPGKTSPGFSSSGCRWADVWGNRVYAAMDGDRVVDRRARALTAVMRLTPRGRVDRRFGRHGAALLPKRRVGGVLPARGVTFDAAGRVTMQLVQHAHNGGERSFDWERLRKSGRRDRRFARTTQRVRRGHHRYLDTDGVKLWHDHVVASWVRGKNWYKPRFYRLTGLNPDGTRWPDATTVPGPTRLATAEAGDSLLSFEPLYDDSGWPDGARITRYELASP